MKNKQSFKTGWDLRLLYKNANDPQIEQDMQAIENACKNFEKKYKKTDFIKNSVSLEKALADYEKVQKLLNEVKPWWYFALQSDIDSSNNVIGARATKYEQRCTVATNRITFFTLAIGTLPLAQQKQFLNDTSLSRYQYFLKLIFAGSPYMLSEGEEQLSSLLSQTSSSMWIDGQNKVLRDQMIKWKGKEQPISTLMAQISELPKKDRHALYGKIYERLKSISSFAESEINAVYNYKKIMDERRGYQKPYSSTILSYENNEQSIEMLVQLVTKYFSISKRFFRLHAQLLGEKKISNADRQVKIGDIKKKFDFAASVTILKKAFGNIDQRYADILDSYVAKGQIDVYPKQGKRSGAYCWGMGNLPTVVLLNHVDDLRSLETLGHEMGHAFHSELSKQQPIYYQGHSTATAEVASTFFEQVALNAVEEQLSDKEKIIMLHTRLMGDIASIFRQIACFNFELELHKEIRARGQVSKSDMANLLVKHLHAYMGDAVELSEIDGYFFIWWSHIRNHFYVYSYAYGQLISRALFEQWKQNPAYGKKIEQFLSAGRSMSPEAIFKSIGIDTSKPEFFETGLKGIENDIKQLEKLVKNNKK